MSYAVTVVTVVTVVTMVTIVTVVTVVGIRISGYRFLVSGFMLGCEVQPHSFLYCSFFITNCSLI